MNKNVVPIASLIRVTRRNELQFVREFHGIDCVVRGRRYRGWYYLFDGAVIGPFRTAAGAYREAANRE